jgi:hypothetical protein
VVSRPPPRSASWAPCVSTDPHELGPVPLTTGRPIYITATRVPPPHVPFELGFHCCRRDRPRFIIASLGLLLHRDPATVELDRAQSNFLLVIPIPESSRTSAAAAAMPVPRRPSHHLGRGVGLGALPMLPYCCRPSQWRASLPYCRDPSRWCASLP